jgi:hypothetical protein
VRHLSPAEVYDRHCNGQCFNCEEKYVGGHNRVCAKLFYQEMHEEDEDDNMDAAVDQPCISLLAIAGIRTRDTMQVAVRFGAVTVTTLLDFGSTQLRVGPSGDPLRPFLHPPRQRRRDSRQWRSSLTHRGHPQRHVLHRL